MTLVETFFFFFIYFLNSSNKDVSAESRLQKLHGDIKTSLKIDHLVSPGSKLFIYFILVKLHFFKRNFCNVVS